MNNTIMDIPGWFSQDDINAIQNIAANLPDSGVLVELGSFFGRSASKWATILRGMNKNYKIYCVDTYCCTPEEIARIHNYLHHLDGDLSLVQDFLDGKETHLEVATRLMSTIPELVMVNHDIYGEEPFLDAVDCVFEDAYHNFDKYNIAVDKWYPRLSTNGIFCGHDYNTEIPIFAELCRAVDYVAETKGLQLIRYPNSVVYSYAAQSHS